MLTLFLLHYILLAFFLPIQMQQDLKEPNYLLGSLQTYTPGKLHVKKTLQPTSEMITALRNSSLISFTLVLRQLPAPNIWRGPTLNTSFSWQEQDITFSEIDVFVLLVTRLLLYLSNENHLQNMFLFLSINKTEMSRWFL